MSDESASLDDLQRLVAQRLLERTESLTPSALAAFVDGWVSLLELLERADLTLPDAPPEVREAVADVVRAIRAAQAQVLDDEA